MRTASARERLAAGAIDARVGLRQFAGICVVVFPAVAIQDPLDIEWPDLRGLKPAFRAVELVGTVLYRRKRSRGYRAVGLRRVDAETGRPVRIQSAIMSAAYRSCMSAGTARLYRRLGRARARRWAEHGPVVNEIFRQHAGDRPGTLAALAAYEAETGFSAKPGPASALPILGCLAFRFAVWCTCCTGRSVYDRVTGTRVVALNPR